ncbi:MAG: rhomboid family intramembrane serine protease [Rhizobiaceae bacterium]
MHNRSVDEDSAIDERGRQPIFNLPAVVVALIGTQVAIHLIRLYLLDREQDLWVVVNFAFVPVFYSGQFEMGWWSFTAPLTYSLLHATIPHVAINMIWLAAFGSPLANRLGTVRFLLFWAVTAVAAAGLHYVLHRFDQAPLVGASGAVSGMMGAAARLGFRIDRSLGKPAFAGPVLPVSVVLRMRPVVTFLAVWMAINLVTGVFGLMPGEPGRIAWEAHVGGFLVGFLFVARFDPPGRAARSHP